MLFRSDLKSILVNRARFDRSDTMTQGSRVAAAGSARAQTRILGRLERICKESRYLVTLSSMDGGQDGGDTSDELQGVQMCAFPGGLILEMPQRYRGDEIHTN